MKIIFLLTLVISLYGQKILLINSNSNIQKYKSAESSFKKNFDKPFDVIDISSMKRNEIKNYLYDEYPDIIYTIGVKAYQYTDLFIPEKSIFFSSVINYKRLKLQGNRYGVSNELHPSMKLTIIKSLFPDLGSLSIFYSDYTEDLYKSFKQSARNIGIEINGKKVSLKNSLNIDNLNNTDGFILLADPILLENETYVKEFFKKMKHIKKPIFAYDELFINYGATLVISAHNPTIGNQISLMIDSYLENKKFKNIQIPAGTNVIFNKKVADSYSLKYNKFFMSIVNKVVK